MNLIRRVDGRPVLGRSLFMDDFEDMFRNLPGTAVDKLLPVVDVVEEKDKFTLKADLPGLKQSDVKISLISDILTISGERKHEKQEHDEKKHYHYYERSYGSFERRFTLPAGTDAGKIKAKMENGVLVVEIPKEEAKMPKEIKVE